MGWDTHLFNKHKDKKVHFNQSSDQIVHSQLEEEEIKIIESSHKLYDWFKNNNINVRLLTDISPIDDRFERIKSIKDI